MVNTGITVRRALTGLAALLAIASTTAEPASAQVSTDGTCGFYFTNPDHERATARYYHCGNSSSSKSTGAPPAGAAMCSAVVFDAVLRQRPPPRGQRLLHPERPGPDRGR